VEIASIVAGGIFSISFLIAIWLWNKKSYRKVVKTEENDSHRVEQNNTIKHYEKKRDKLSKLKKISDAEVTPGVLGKLLSAIVGMAIAFFVGSQIYTTVMSSLNDTCSNTVNTTGYNPVLDTTSCGVLSNAMLLFPISAIIGFILVIFSIFSNLGEDKK
jgi:hypothetical protein